MTSHSSISSATFSRYGSADAAVNKLELQKQPLPDNALNHALSPQKRPQLLRPKNGKLQSLAVDIVVCQHISSNQNHKAFSWPSLSFSSSASILPP
jgi:hypothetical protein